jgi:hypothetical protein
LFGFVNDGTTQSAVRHVPFSRRLAMNGARPEGDRLIDVIGLAAVDAHDDQRTPWRAIAAAVDG